MYFTLPLNITEEEEIDDDPLLVRANGNILANHGYKVTETIYSREALEKIRRKSHLNQTPIQHRNFFAHIGV